MNQTAFEKFLASFNSSKVQLINSFADYVSLFQFQFQFLKGSINNAVSNASISPACFNSSKVQLIKVYNASVQESDVCFNSSKVQLINL